MSQFIEGSMESEAFEHASDIVLGVVSARQRDAPDDVAVLLKDYFATWLGKGMSVSSAWTMLFSASTIWLTNTIGDFATISGDDPQVMVATMSLRRARELNR